jgi:hypothetical protein
MPSPSLAILEVTKMVLINYLDFFSPVMGFWFRIFSLVFIMWGVFYVFRET